MLNWVISKGEEDFNENVDNHVIRNRSHEMYLQKVNKI